MGICKTQSAQAFSLAPWHCRESVLSKVLNCGYPHGKIRKNRVQIRLAAAPPTDANTHKSQYTGSQTEHSDSSDDIASPAQPLRLTNGPKPPLNQGLRSLQAEPPNPGNQPFPAKNPSPAIASPQIQLQSTDSVQQ